MNKSNKIMMLNPMISLDGDIILERLSQLKKQFESDDDSSCSKVPFVAFTPSSPPLSPSTLTSPLSSISIDQLIDSDDISDFEEYIKVPISPTLSSQPIQSFMDDPIVNSTQTQLKRNINMVYENKKVNNGHGGNRRSGQVVPRVNVCVCGSTTPGKGPTCKWRKGPNGEVLCNSCGLQNMKRPKCMICEKVYNAKDAHATNDSWIRCEDCKFWVMSSCENITDISIYDSETNPVLFNCKKCKSKRQQSPLKSKPFNSTKQFHKSLIKNHSKQHQQQLSSTSNPQQLSPSKKLTKQLSNNLIVIGNHKSSSQSQQQQLLEIFPITQQQSSPNQSKCSSPCSSPVSSTLTTPSSSPFLKSSFTFNSSSVMSRSTTPSSLSSLFNNNSNNKVNFKDDDTNSQTSSVLLNDEEDNIIEESTIKILELCRSTKEEQRQLVNKYIQDKRDRMIGINRESYLSDLSNLL